MIINNKNNKIIQLCMTIGVRGRRGRGSSRGRGPQSSRRTSSIPWVSVSPDQDTEPPQLPFATPVSPDWGLPASPKPVHFFRVLFTASVIQLIVDETNR